MQLGIVIENSRPYFTARGVPDSELSKIWEIVRTYDGGTMCTCRCGEYEISCYRWRLQSVSGPIALSVAGAGSTLEYHTEQSLIERLSALPDTVGFGYHRLDNPALVHYYNG